MGVGRAELYVTVIVLGSAVSLFWLAVAVRYPIPGVDRVNSTAAQNAAAAGATGAGAPSMMGAMG